MIPRKLAPADTELRQQIIANVDALAARVLHRAVPAMSESTKLREDLGMTSVTILELILELEEALAIEVDVESLDGEHTATIGALADFLLVNSRRAG